MFWKCSSITEIDLSNFNTSRVESMYNMFRYCSSLTSLNLSNFNTSQVWNFHCMFFGCSSLASLDLSSFDTSKVKFMHMMFFGCSSLASLDLSNFDTSEVIQMENMFNGCTQLKYINLNNFDESQLTGFDNMFNKIPENAIICLKDINAESKIISQINNGKMCYAIDCIDDSNSKQIKLNNNVNECNQLCDKSLQYLYEYNGRCYKNCVKGFLYDNNNNNKMNKCKCELDECLICPKEALNKGLCTKCNTNYYQKENDILNNGEFIKCYKDPEGYYLDNNLYKQCYYTCKICDISGNKINHNCIKCNDDYPKEIKNNNFINCYKNCEFFYYFDEENNYHCTIDSSCPNEYPKLNEINNECIKNNFHNLIEDLKIKENDEIEKMSKDEEIEYYDNLLKIIENAFTEKYDTSILDNSEDEYIETKKMTVTFTTPDNQRNNINNNKSIIDIGECEILLRNYYNISNNEKLYIKKIDIVQEGMTTTKVEYDVYCKLSGTNLKKLNLTICTNSKILIFMPFNLNGNIDEYNSSSGYYNDMCYTVTTKDGTDITMKDRQKGFINENKIVCQEDCFFSKYNYELSKTQCSCDVKESSSSIKYMAIDKSKISIRKFQRYKKFCKF